MARFEVGHKLMNPISKDVFIFAGYDQDGTEMWCEIMSTPWGDDVLSAPERKTFEGFEGEYTKFSQSVGEFAASVTKERLN